MPKSRPLNDEEKRKLITYHLKYPNIKPVDLCRQFNITRNQFEFALAKHKAGKLTKGNRRKANGKRVDDLLKEKDSDTLLIEQLDYAIAQMTANPNLDTSARIDMLHKLVSTRHTHQRITLQGHLRKVDAEVFSALVRLFVPNATDDEVISYYKQAVEIVAQVSK